MSVVSSAPLHLAPRNWDIHNSQEVKLSFKALVLKTPHPYIFDMPLSKEKKAAYFERLENLLGEYNKVFIVSVDNVGSQQMQITRQQMRGTAEILMGKNTMVRKVFSSFLEKNPGKLALKPHRLVLHNYDCLYFIT